MGRREEKQPDKTEPKPKAVKQPRTASKMKLEARKRDARQRVRKQARLQKYIDRMCESHGLPKPVQARTLGRARKCVGKMLAKQLNTPSYQARLRRRAERREEAERRAQSQATKEAYLGPSDNDESLLATEA